MDNGADVSSTTLLSTLSGSTVATTALHCAAFSDHVDLLRFLHAQGPLFIAEAGGQVKTALHDTECVRYILACGFDVDTRESNNLTPSHCITALHCAAEHGHSATIELLLNSGADIEAIDDDGYTPLISATVYDQAEVVSLLIARGVSITDGRAADAGAQCGSIAALKALMLCPRWLAMSRTERLQAECSLLHFVNDTATLIALHSLVMDISVLLGNCVHNGNNALHTAAEYSKAVPLICALIKEGVDLTALNNSGQMPADVASEAGHTLQATLLNRAAEDKRERDLKAAAAAPAAAAAAAAPTTATVD